MIRTRDWLNQESFARCHRKSKDGYFNQPERKAESGLPAKQFGDIQNITSYPVSDHKQQEPPFLEAPLHIVNERSRVECTGLGLDQQTQP